MTGLFALLMAYRGLNRLGIAPTTPVLAATALLAGLATALCETAWYALSTGVSAWLVFQANADIVVYQDLAALRPGHWVAFAGLLVALAHAVRAPKAQPPRQARQGVPARANS